MSLWNFAADHFLSLTPPSPPLIPLHGEQLQMRYPNQEWIYPGSTIDIRDTGRLPEIGTVGLDCNSRYLIVSLDPDVVLPGTGIQTIILHWYQSNFTFSCNGAGDSGVLKPGDDHGGDKHDSNTAPYIPPQPPVGSHHRYVFLLFNQSQSYEFPDCFEHIPPQTKDARSGFDIREFMLVAELDPPIAINYFYGRHTASYDEHTLPSSSVTQTSFKSLDCQIGPTS